MSLSDYDLQDLYASGLSDQQIEMMDCETLSLDATTSSGFRLSVDYIDLMQSYYIQSCLFIPFRNPDGTVVQTANDLKWGVVKPKYTEQAKQKFDKLPKYLGLPKSVIGSMHAHFPHSIDWGSHFKSKKPKLFITEGPKKAEKACLERIPCIALTSVWCFGENGIDSSLIPEIKSIIEQYKPEVYIVFDSDKAWKDGVTKAELALTEKIFQETGAVAKVVDLPCLVGSKQTKGLDDYLMAASKDDFMQLVEKSRVPFSPLIASKKHFSVPKAPFKAMPELLELIIDDFQNKYEGCYEMASMGLLASTAICMRNRISIEGKRPNLYMIGIADTVSGKSTVARASLKALNSIDDQLLCAYLNDQDIAQEETENNDK